MRRREKEREKQRNGGGFNYFRISLGKQFSSEPWI